MIERVTLGGVEFQYDTERKTISMGGQPAIFVWTESTLAGALGVAAHGGHRADSALAPWRWP